MSFLQQARYPTGTGQLWSLAVEEQFYLFWPLALIGLLAIARRFRHAPLIVVSLVIVVVAVRRAVVYFGIPATTFQTYGWSDLYQRTDFRLDDLLWGVLLAMVWVRGSIPAAGWWSRAGSAPASW